MQTLIQNLEIGPNREPAAMPPGGVETIGPKNPLDVPFLFAQETEMFNGQERRYNDITTWAAEVLDGSMRTSFEYTFDGEELYAGDGSPMGPIFDKAIEDAYKIAELEPVLAVEVGRRKTERAEYDDMLEMASGKGFNTMLVISDFPEALKGFGRDAGGYNTTRMQTMARAITRTEDGKIRIVSQTLDRSDRDGLESIYRQFGLKPEPGELLGQRMYMDLGASEQDAVMDRIVNTYDRTLGLKHGRNFYAGRTPAEVENTYNFVIRQDDLINAYLANENDDNKYALAAALDSRWKRNKNFSPSIDIPEFQGGLVSAQMEMSVAAEMSRRQGKTYSGCGYTAGGSGLGAPMEFAILGYGNLAADGSQSSLLSDEYGPRVFSCGKGHLNTRPYRELIPCCTTCGVSVKC